MNSVAGVTGIDPRSWTVTILPLPKRFSRGVAYGFCSGHPVGRAETARGKSFGCWWPDNEPLLLAFDEKNKEVTAGRPSGGELIPGHRSGKGGAMKAVAWKLDGECLVPADLHDESYESTWATGAGGGVVVGMGTPPGKLGKRGPDVGLLWRDGAETAVITGIGNVNILATDGTRLAGSLDGRATLWPSAGATPIDLAPASMPPSEVDALDAEWQVGIAWKGMCARAGLWRGTAASFCDLTPDGFESGRAFGAAEGYQAGFVRRRDTTLNGSSGSDDCAVLWQGAANRWFNLNELLPEKKYNASVAWAIEVRGDTVRICGEASRYEVSDPGTPQESHFVPVAHPVLWTARLGGG